LRDAPEHCSECPRFGGGLPLAQRCRRGGRARSYHTSTTKILTPKNCAACSQTSYRLPPEPPERRCHPEASSARRGRKEKSCDPARVASCSASRGISLRVQNSDTPFLVARHPDLSAAQSTCRPVNPSRWMPLTGRGCCRRETLGPVPRRASALGANRCSRPRTSPVGATKRSPPRRDTISSATRRT
jgi:hypothetical protein